jgi:thymidylate synthase (FAD)
MNVLDHGFVNLVESWGSDERIIEAARQSVGGGFVSWAPYEGHPKGDAGLLRYMWEHEHATPFEFAGAVFEVRAPIFVFREWHRHRVQAFSEASARYAPLPDLNYVPTVERMLQKGGASRQAGSTGATLTQRQAEFACEGIANTYKDIQYEYEGLLENGVPKELARLVLPVGRYSQMRASANLRNWLAFLKLRQAPNAQHEIRVYANAVHDMLAEKFPRTVALFDEGAP